MLRPKDYGPPTVPAVDSLTYHDPTTGTYATDNSTPENADDYSSFSTGETVSWEDGLSLTVEPPRRDDNDEETLMLVSVSAVNGTPYILDQALVMSFNARVFADGQEVQKYWTVSNASSILPGESGSSSAQYYWPADAVRITVVWQRDDYHSPITFEGAV